MTSQYAADQPTGYTNYIKNVAIVGASGQVGKHITSELLKTGKHSVTAITRVDSKSQLPPGIAVAKVDYDDHTSLVDALRGHDALIITMFARAPKESSVKLVEAAIEAGVPYILPNEWGSDYTDREMNKDTGLGDNQLAIRQLIESKGTKTAWIAVACAFWYDYSLSSGPAAFGFDFPNKEAIFYDDGKHKMRFSTLPYTGEAAAKLLSLPILPQDSNDKTPCLASFRNTIVRVTAFHIDQYEMLASVLRVSGDKESDWKIKHASSKSRYEEGKKLLGEGKIEGFRMMLYSRMFYPSNPAKRPEDYSDEILGLQKPSLDESTKWALDQVKAQAA